MGCLPCSVSHVNFAPRNHERDADRANRTSSVPLLLENAAERVASHLLHVFLARYQSLSRVNVWQLLERIQWSTKPENKGRRGLHQRRPVGVAAKAPAQPGPKRRK